MFGDAQAISWSDFFTQGGDSAQSAPASAPADNTDVITTTTTGADTRNVSELQARIKASGGKLTAAANSSDYIVAVNNRLRFSVTRDASGQFVITESQSYLWLIGLAVVGGIVILASR
jgi:hypothetical protein